LQEEPYFLSGRWRHVDLLFREISFWHHFTVDFYYGKPKGPWILDSRTMVVSWSLQKGNRHEYMTIDLPWYPCITPSHNQTQWEVFTLNESKWRF
jgi:hypothetical protein